MAAEDGRTDLGLHAAFEPPLKEEFAPQEKLSSLPFFLSHCLPMMIMRAMQRSTPTNQMRIDEIARVDNEDQFCIGLQGKFIKMYGSVG